MLKIERAKLDHIDERYPGIAKTMREFEEASLPACSHCGSKDTANVQCGITGRTINIAAATTKIKLTANGPAPGKYFCNTCYEFFD